MASPPAPQPVRLRPLPNFIFLSRWLQLPLYLGLILAQCVYVYHFWVELVHLLQAAMGSSAALTALLGGIGYELAPPGATTASGPRLTETVIMLAVLGLIDVVMISNLLIMVIVGGYETFVSRLKLENHPDQPEWLSHVNASVLKVKLAMAIIGISSIHLLKTFIAAGNIGGMPMCTPEQINAMAEVAHKGAATCAMIVFQSYCPALMNVFRRWIEEMPMIAVASFTLSTEALTWDSHSGSS